LGLTLDTPLFDVPLTVGGNSPNNADGRFNGYMPLREALAYSRNIAPIKLFLAMGGEDILKPFLQRLGLVNLSAAVNYGYPLAIGA
jgi:penicillin-binding protein 1A